MQASLPLPVPATFPPIASLAPHALELLLLGCSQASSPTTLCDGLLNRIVVDQIHHELRHYSASTSPAHTTFLTHPQNNAVNPELSPHHLSFLHHDTRSEIASSLIPANPPIRYQSASARSARSLTHSFYHTIDHHDSPASRSLATTVDVSQLIMATTTSAPGSPPDLSGSRSSKSSSCSSGSQDSNHEPLLTDATNFEEIGLDDDRHGNLDDSQKRSLGRSKTAGATIRSISSSPLDTRPPLPSLHNQVREAVRQNENGGIQGKKGTTFSAMRRGFSSPLTTFAGASARPRSSSPPKRIPSSHSSTALSADSLPIQATNRSSFPLASRRGSWQQRKSVQELEAEYHDSDDELPDDTSLWNVPVSPHMGERSARSSFHGSPNREPTPRSPMPIPLAHANTTPEIQPKPMKGQAGSRLRPPRSASMTTSLSNPSSPRARNFQRSGRARSWNLAMENLSEEARIVSEALEHHAEESRRTRQAGPGANSSTDSLQSYASHSRPHQIQLPPVQKGSLDFMPMSKEKEAILSRTRPSWLPPKDPKEERRHLREYQRMMAASVEADKKRSDKMKTQEFENDTAQDALNRIWTYYCEESTDLTTIDKRVFDLCWNGITPKLRGRVWQRAIGNPLGLTATSFDKALSRAYEIQGKSQPMEFERRMNGWFKDIERDAETAFPELNVFQRHGPLWQDLIDVCKAYACYRTDIGYLYGQQLTAALLLLQVPRAADAFILLANCLNRSTPLAFQNNEMSTLARTYNHAVSTLAIKFPRLHSYLFGSIEEGGLGFTSELIFQPMFRTLFCNGLDVDKLCRVWDLWAFEGDKSLVRTAVAILGCLQSQLFEVQGDVDLRRRNIQEMLAWGPFNRTVKGAYWDLRHIKEEKFVDEVRNAGVLDYRIQ